MTNFVHKDTTDADLELFFGPLESETFEDLADDEQLEHLVVRLGKFPSLNRARKNNWKGEIPVGFKAWKIGKTHFWTFKPFD